MALTQIDDRGLKTPIDLLDDEKIRFGTSDDLEIFHGGGHSKIYNANGNIYISNESGNSSNIVLQATWGEESIIAKHNAGVELYYDNSKKIETTSSGVAITGVLSSNQTSGQAISIGDNAQINLGAGDDLKLWHQTGNSYVTSTGANLTLRAAGHLYLEDIDGNNMADFNDGGAVELSYDGTKKFETDTNGVTITGQCAVTSHVAWPDHSSGYVGKAVFGGGDDIQIYHDGSNSYVKNTTGDFRFDASGPLMLRSDDIRGYNAAGTEFIFRGQANGSVSLYYDNNLKLTTVTDGVRIDNGNLRLDRDDAYIKIGAGNDLQIVHDGSHSRISAYNTGNLLLKSQNDTKIEFGDEGGATELGLHATRNAGVDLYHNNSKILETLGNGVRVQGGVMFGSDTADANRITDYEQGTWTPDPFHHSSVNSAIGRYTKIGNMVYAYFSVTYYSSSSSQQYISNLPFVSVSGTGGTGGVARGYQNKDIQDGPIYSIGTNTNDLYWYRDNGVAFPASDGSGNSFTGTVVYQV